jgi:hypothetical protein
MGDTLFRNMDDRKFQEERKILMSCSSDDAKMASTELIRQSRTRKHQHREIMGDFVADQNK